MSLAVIACVKFALNQFDLLSCCLEFVLERLKADALKEVLSPVKVYLVHLKSFLAAAILAYLDTAFDEQNPKQVAAQE